MRRIPLLLTLLVLALVGVAAPASARRRRPAPPPPRPTPPPQVLLRDPLTDPRDPAYRIARKLRLEPGACVRPTAGLSPGEAAADREKYLLLATQAVEGGYDAVNIYDRGIVSWGLMQWAAHENSLQEALWYMKGRLLRKNKGRVWAALWKAHGLDVQRGPGGAPAFFVGGPDAWRPVVGKDALRVLFRGTKKVGKYDPVTATRWAKVFCRAGRDRTVQALQVEWATARLRACLGQRIDGAWRARDFSRGDLFSDALTFALWTNNPRACHEHLRRAVRASRLVTGEADPADWPAGLFPLLWEQTARRSEFGVWPKRAAAIARLVPVGQVGRHRAFQELASRGWQIHALQRGGGRLWRREPPKPATAKAPKPAAAKAPKPGPSQAAAPARDKG